MITNDIISTPEDIRRHYRANDENVIKDLKGGYGFETFHIKNFQALQHNYFTLSRQLGSGGRRYVLRLSVQERKIRAKIVSIMRRIYLMPHRLNCIAVDQ